jgi:transcriptional regulator with XRE-family HTH domain
MLSIPFVSHGNRRPPYPVRVKEKTPLGWGARFREQIKAKGKSLGQIAEKLGLAESTVRSWTNGTRDVNLSDYLKLCAAAQLDPVVSLVGSKVDAKFLLIGEAWAKATPEQRGYLLTVAKGILSEHEADAERSRAGARLA